MDATNNAPDTIVLIHGLWMTPRSWEHWVKHFEQKGFKVLAPAYPGLEVEVEALRADSKPIAELSVAKVVEHYENIVRALPKPPILMGHSFGGTIVQLLLDKGLGAAGVVIGSGPVKGVYKVPLTLIRSTFPVLKNPANRNRAVPFTHDQFHFAFTNMLSEEESKPFFERYAIPAPGRIVFDGATQNFDPGAPTKVDFEKPDRAPLLFIASSEDHIMSAGLNRSNAKHYRSGTIGFREFEGRGHFTVGEAGWEAVADFALEWTREPTATGLQ